MATIEEIRVAVANAFNLKVSDLESQSSTRANSIPRQIAMYLAKELTDASLHEIGTHFGGRHHTTVKHAIVRVRDLRRCETSSDAMIARLCAELQKAPS